MTLPKLLEETPRPDKKRLKTFYDYIHRWRCSLFQQWKSAAMDGMSDECLGRSVDRLIDLILLLEHCKRYGYFDTDLSSFTNVWSDGTLADLQNAIVVSISCPILQKVFTPTDTDDITLQSSFLESRFEQRIRSSLWLLFQEQTIPLWLFGDYHQLCVANPPGQIGERKRSSKIRYARGIHYTPVPIVDYMTATILDDASCLDSPGVLDPSCGCGSFLIAAFRHIVEKKTKGQSSTNRERIVLEILDQSLFGVDVDSQAIDWTIRLLYLECRRLIGTEKNPIPSSSVPDISDHFLVKSFFDVDRQTFGGRVKTILGGPPFVRYAELKKNQPGLIDQLRERFSSIKAGQFDLYMPFIEHAVNLLDDGQQVGFSLSNSFLHIGTGKGICRFIQERCTPLEVLEFSGGSIYPDASVQIALLRLAVGKMGSNRGKYVLLEPATDVRDALEQLYAPAPLPLKTGKEIPLEENELAPKIIPATPAIRCDGIRFGDLPVEFFYGATSKSDEIFMLKDRGVGSQGIRHGLTRRSGEKVQCERKLSVPIIRGREIKGFRYSPVKYFYLAPYDEGKLIDCQTLKNDYPITFRYLERFQTLSKEKEDWYAYYTPPAYREDEVIVSCQIASPRSFARMDLSEKTIHGSAFGVAVKGGEMNISLLLLYLNSGDFWGQIDATMPPMGVGRRSIRMSTLKGLLIPRQIAFPSEHNVSEAKVLEKRIVQTIGGKKPEVIQSIFAELDSFIDLVIFQGREIPKTTRDRF